jgi:predicted phosphodiesterase
MRIGLIADLHGNAFALEAALSALEHEGIDQLVCLGDVAVFGPQPRTVIARLRQLACPVVMGNTDAWALDPTPHAVRDADTPYVNAVELWSAAQLDDTDRTFLRSFPPTVELGLSREHHLLCYHGSPRSFDEVLLATTPDGQVEAALAGCTATLLAGGHTHTQMVRRYADKVLINPGSVGQPLKVRPNGGAVHYAPWAEFAVVEVVGDDLSVELRRVPVDVQAVVELAYSCGMPHPDWWAARWAVPG